jgi:hypothetical protein
MPIKTAKLSNWGLLVVFLTAVLFVGGVYAKTIYKQVEVYPPTKEDLKQFLRMGFDPSDAMIYDEGRRVVAVLNDQEMELLKSTGLDYRVLIEDLEQYYSSQFLATADMGPYTSYSEMVDSLTDLHNHHPDITTELVVLGYGHDGNEVYAMKISDNPNLQEDEPEALFEGMQHAREPIAMENLLYFMAYLCNNYGEDPEVTELVDERQLWFIPCVNPDGYLYNEQTNPNGGGMWRKNRRNNGGGSYGVDTNRNWGYKWGYDNYGSSPNPSSETYRGPYAFSEPETQACSTFAMQHNFITVMDDHTYGYEFLSPWCYDDFFTLDQDMFVGIGEEAVELLQPANYARGTSWQVLYNSNGNCKDWYYGRAGAFTFTPEIGESFWPGGSRILPLCEEMLPVNLLFADVCANPWQMVRVWAPAIEPIGSVPGGDFTVRWNLAAGDTLPDKYQLQEMTGPFTITDDVESGSGNWHFKSFSRSSSRSYSGSYSFWSGYQNCYNATMTSVTPIKVESGTQLSFRLWYQIETNYDFGFVEVSTNGYNWDILDTYTGSNTSWSLKTYNLASYAGEYLQVRFRFETDIGSTTYGMYIDDIYPVDVFDNVVTLSDNITENYYEVTGRTPGTYYYQVRGHNRTGWGHYSPREAVIVTEGAIVSIELVPDDPPVVVPQGGSFGYTGTVTNNTDEVQFVDIWTMAYVPGIGWHGPLRLYNNVRFNPGQIRSAHLNQRVPNVAPVSDSYLYCGYVGDYPSTVIDSSCFPFEVIPGVSTKAGEGGWVLTGSFLEGDFADLPSEFALLGNYPNPFNAQTVISYELPVSGHVRLEVYNLLGQKVATLVNSEEGAGHKSATWDASEVSSGLYFYKLSCAGVSETRRMILIK